MDYVYPDVTEISGDEVIQKKVERNYQRYYWAREYCRGRNAVECPFMST